MNFYLIQTRVAAWLAAAAMSLIAATGTLAQPSDVLELRLALAVADTNLNPTQASVFRLAETFGFYEKHGVKVTIVALDGTPQAVAALNSGAVDIADITIDSAIRLRADNDVPIRGIVAIASGNPFLIAAKSEIKSVEDLEGRSYAIADNGSLDHILTQAVLGSFGMEDKSPNFVAIGPPDVRVQALAAGRVDATTVSFGTFLSIADTPGINVLVPPEEYSKRSPGISKFIAALEGTIETKREALQRFTNALIDASRAMESDPDRWIAAVGEARDDLSPERIQATADFMDNQWCVTGCMDPDKLQEAVEFIYTKPDFEDVKAVPTADLLDLSFTEQAVKALGPYSPEPS